MIKEKQRFKKNPTNYAMRKTELMKELQLAEESAEQDEAQRVKVELEELEERASSLDHRRTQTLHVVDSINLRNRKKNINLADIRASAMVILNQFQIKIYSGIEGEDK